MNKKQKEKICPICKKLIVDSDDRKYGPFCSKRCQIIDLGQWLEEKYVVSKDKEEEDKENEQ